jgi:hypothetical protein
MPFQYVRCQLGALLTEKILASNEHLPKVSLLPPLYLIIYRLLEARRWRGYHISMLQRGWTEPQDPVKE